MASRKPTSIQNSLSAKLAAIVFGGALVFAVALTGLNVWSDYQEQLERITETLDGAVHSHQAAISAATWNDDRKAIENELEGLATLKEIDAIELTTEDAVTYSAGDLQAEFKFMRDYPVRVRIAEEGADRTIGNLRIHSTLSPLWKRVQAKAAIVLAQELILCFVVTALLFGFMHFFFVRHLRQITAYLGDFRPDKDLPHLRLQRAERHAGYDELDALAEHINSLKDRVLMSHWALKEVNSHLERRVEERTQTILEQRQKLEVSARFSALGEMAGSIAHEINNPLAIIMGKSQLLLKKEQVPATRTALESIVKTTGRIAEIIQSLRVLSRDASQDPFEFISLSVVVKDALGLSGERLRQKGIEIRVCPSLGEWEISCRRVQIAQILVNLINNSIDALENSRQKWIEMRVREEGGFLVLSATDAGRGIPIEIREKIMTPFFTTKEVGKGTGMGLSLSRSIMSAHDGTLDIDFRASHTTLRLTFRNYRPALDFARDAG